MTSTLSHRGQLLLGAVRRNFQLLEEHSKTHPDEVNAIAGLIVAHVRSSRPEALLAAETGPVVRLSGEHVVPVLDAKETP